MVTVTHRKSGNPLAKALRIIQRTRVYVGIPAANNKRNEEEGRQNVDEEGKEITNSDLLFILSHGVRRKSMRAEMQANMDNKMKYSKAYDLYIQAHGSPLWHSPPRPVLEPSIEHNKAAIAKKLNAAYHAVFSGDPNYMAKYEDAGTFAKVRAQKWFDDPANGWPANSPITIAKKGSSHPNVDTDQMRTAITYVVREE